MSSSALAALGWNERLATLSTDLAPHLLVGRVTRVDRGRATVATDGGELRPRTPEPVAVGDWVALDGDAVGAVLPRRSALTRRSPDKATTSLVVAANIDHVVLVHGLHQPVNVRRLERELVLAWDSGAVPLVLLTKCDLAADPDAQLARAADVALGVDVLLVSGRTGEGLEAVRDRLSAGKTFVLLGASGAGKSTLLNALAGHELQQTQDLREADQRGRHTTTAGQLVVLPGGAILVDTPGIKAVGLWDDGAGVAQVFADIDALAARCRFTDCQHRSEPGCAVRGAVADERIESWRKLARELARTAGDRRGWEIAESNKRLRALHRSRRGATYRQ